MKIPNSIMKGLLFLLAVTMIACQGKTKRNSADVQYAEVELALLSYWEDFDFSDTAVVMNPEVGEQRLVDFIAVFPKVSDTIRKEAIYNMLAKAEAVPGSFKYFIGKFEHYLYDPNSPMRNDLYYENVLAFLVDSKEISDAERFGYNNLLNLVRKNQIGLGAADFRFLLPDGDNSSLYEVDAKLTLLFFYEPGCSFCEVSIEQLESSSFFQKMIAEESLDVVAIYPYPELDIWKGYQDRIPANWINGFDSRSQILEKQLYDIRATPTIYLLDENKEVLLKDTELVQVAHFLENYTIRS